MRTSFIKTLVKLAQTDERIFLLTGDLGYMALEPFANQFPDRFINAGAAEQNMVGIATGLAEAGFIPFVYSIVTFASLRPYEFIRNGPIAHNLPVRIVGVGGGIEYGHNGISHYGLEDIAVMRAQPGISIFAPADAKQTVSVLEKTWNLEGPIYYRLGKDDKTVIANLDGAFNLNETQLVSDGQDCLIVTVGGIANEGAAAALELSKQGISCAHAVLASIRPVPTDNLIKLLKRFPLVVSVEAHYEAGGLGSLLSDLITDHNLKCRLKRIAVRRTPDCFTGSQSFMQTKHGLSQDQIVEQVKEWQKTKLQEAIS